MDHVLNAHQKEIRNGQSKEFRLLSVLLPMVKNTKDKLIQYLGGRNLGFNAKQVNCNVSFYQTGPKRASVEIASNSILCPEKCTKIQISASSMSVIEPDG